MTKKHYTQSIQSAATEQAGLVSPARSPSDARSDAWKRRLHELAAFKREFGHCCVSTLSKDHASLGNWVRTQRGRRRLGRLSREQISLLDELGFSWGVLPAELQSETAAEPADAGGASWEIQCAALAAFQRAYGHCRVSCSTGDQAGLAHWVAAQRRARRLGKLSAEQIRRLEDFGFSWNGREGLDRARWESMYQDLVAYQQEHGQRQIPGNKHFSRLRHWVVRQRVARRKGKLSADQVRKLSLLNFVWDQAGEQWKTMLAALVQYKKAHGNCNVPGGWCKKPQAGCLGEPAKKMPQKGDASPRAEKAIGGTGVSVQLPGRRSSERRAASTKFPARDWADPAQPANGCRWSQFPLLRAKSG